MIRCFRLFATLVCAGTTESCRLQPWNQPWGTGRNGRTQERVGEENFTHHWYLEKLPRLASCNSVFSCCYIMFLNFELHLLPFMLFFFPKFMLYYTRIKHWLLSPLKTSEDSLLLRRNILRRSCSLRFLQQIKFASSLCHVLVGFFLEECQHLPCWWYCMWT